MQLLLILCAAAAGPPPTAVALAPPMALAPPIADVAEVRALGAADYADVVAEYEKALEDYQDERRAGARPEHPARAFIASFEAVGREGDARGYLWILDHVRDAKLAVKARKQQVTEAFAQLFADTGDAETLTAALERLVERSRDFDLERAREWTSAAQQHASEDVQAAALLALAGVVSERGRTRDEGRLVEARELYARIVEQHGDTDAAPEAADNLFRLLDREYSRAARDHRRVGGDDPVAAYRKRFGRLADLGVGQALLWQARHPEGDGEAASARALALYERLIEEHADADWIGGMADDLGDLAERFGDERALALAERLMEATDNASVRGKLESALAQFNIRVGRPAPDFATADVDGVAFKLSDYRGKVVLLDFWGFW